MASEILSGKFSRGAFQPLFFFPVRRLGERTFGMRQNKTCQYARGSIGQIHLVVTFIWIFDGCGFNLNWRSRINYNSLSYISKLFNIEPSRKNISQICGLRFKHFFTGLTLLSLVIVFAVLITQILSITSAYVLLYIT